MSPLITDHKGACWSPQAAQNHGELTVLPAQPCPAPLATLYSSSQSGCTDIQAAHSPFQCGVYTQTCLRHDIKGGISLCLYEVSPILYFAK